MKSKRAVSLLIFALMALGSLFVTSCAKSEGNGNVSFFGAGS